MLLDARLRNLDLGSCAWPFLRPRSVRARNNRNSLYHCLHQAKLSLVISLLRLLYINLVKPSLPALTLDGT